MTVISARMLALKVLVGGVFISIADMNAYARERQRSSTTISIFTDTGDAEDGSYIGSLQPAQMTVSGLYNPADAGQQALRNAVDTGVAITMQVVPPGGSGQYQQKYLVLTDHEGAQSPSSWMDQSFTLVAVGTPTAVTVAVASVDTLGPSGAIITAPMQPASAVAVPPTLTLAPVAAPVGPATPASADAVPSSILLSAPTTASFSEEGQTITATQSTTSAVPASALATPATLLLSSAAVPHFATPTSATLTLDAPHA